SRDQRLGNRVKAANTLDCCMTLASARKDRVTFPSMNAPPPSRRAPAPLHTLQQAHVKEAALLEQKLPPNARTGIDPATIMTDVEADLYCSAVFAAARRHLSA